MHDMDKPRTNYGETFTRKVLIPYWFEIVSGIFVGMSMFLIFAIKAPIN